MVSKRQFNDIIDIMKKAIIVICFALSLLAMPVSAISEAQKDAIVEHCVAIRVDLNALLHSNATMWGNLMKHYNKILDKYITPLNVRLVENTLSNDSLVNNQNSFAKTKATFTIDYVEYQKALDSLISVDCKKEPERFYRKLEVVREKRKPVAEDVAKMKKLMETQYSLVNGLREKL